MFPGDICLQFVGRSVVVLALYAGRVPLRASAELAGWYHCLRRLSGRLYHRGDVPPARAASSAVQDASHAGKLRRNIT